jgi:putative holliday junction resolvase
VTRVLAVDWGERRIGLAVSDPHGVIAVGLDTLVVSNPEHGAARVVEVAREHEVGAIVVGLPLLMSGERGEAAVAAEAFAATLAQRSGLPVETYDERLTTALSRRRLRDLGVRTGHARERVDQGAAIALLESYLMRLAARSRAAEALDHED